MPLYFCICLCFVLKVAFIFYYYFFFSPFLESGQPYLIVCHSIKTSLDCVRSDMKLLAFSVHECHFGQCPGIRIFARNFLGDRCSSLSNTPSSSSLQVYEEAGSDFHQVAYFRTRIGLRNALQEEISGSSDKEAVLITLNRPIVFAQPVAFDRGSVSFSSSSQSPSCDRAKDFNENILKPLSIIKRIDRKK